MSGLTWLVSSSMDVHFCRTGQATWERLQGITPLAAGYHTTGCRVSHHWLQGITPLAAGYHTTGCRVSHHWLQGITPLAACWHSLCRHVHDNVLRFILYAGFLQSLNVALTELHIGLGVAKLTGVVVNVLDSQVQLCGSGERVP